MKRETFVSLILAVIGGVLFALGMCMCLLPEWNAFVPGVVMGVIGAAVLLVMLALRRRAQGKPPIRLSKKTAATIALAVVGALVFGAGMCMVMVWNLLVWGIIVGLAGMVLLLCLIPLCKGIK